MPLHREHEMISRRAFQSFDYAIFRTLCHDPEAITGLFRRLMMAGVYAQARGSNQLGQLRCRHDFDIMRELDLSPRFVIDVRFLDVLHQASGPPYVQRLQTVTDS